MRRLQGSDDARDDVDAAFPLLQRLPRRWMPAVATALAFMMAGHHPVQRTGPQDRSLTPILIVQAPCLKRNQGHPAQSHGLVTTLSREPGRQEPYRLVGIQTARSIVACAGHVERMTP